MEINSKIIFKSDYDFSNDDYIEIMKLLYNYLSDEYVSLSKNKDTNVSHYTIILEHIIYALEFIDIYKIAIDEHLLNKYIYLSSIICDYISNNIRNNIVKSIKNNVTDDTIDYSKLTKEQLIELLEKKNK